MDIQARIAVIENELEHGQFDPGSQADNDRREALNKEWAELIQKQQEQAEKSNRQQKAAATIDSYVDTVAQIWDALFPAAIFEGMLGINEYAEKRQDFYKLNHAYFADKVEKLNADHEEEIAAKDERFRRLTAQAQETENQLAEVKRELAAAHSNIADAERAYAELEKDHDELRQDYNELEKDMIENDRLIEQLQLENDELRDKLAASKQPKTAEKPSENLQSILDEIKSKNATMSWGEKANKALERWNLLPLPEIPAPEVEPVGETSFREQDSASDATDRGLHPAGEAEGDVTFPAAAESGMDESGDAGLAAVSREEFEALKARVDRMERANLGAA